MKTEMLRPGSFALQQAIQLWADSTTGDSPRRRDLIRDKTNALLGEGENGSSAGFFVCFPRSPQAVTPSEVGAWRQYLIDMGLAPATVYGRLSRLSSFFRWLRQEPAFKSLIQHNPVDLARPKSPPAYQTPSTRALSDESARALLSAVRAATDSLTGKRDYALLRLFMVTGKRRRELCDLKGGDLHIAADHLLLHTRDKDAVYATTEVRDAGSRDALIAYLQATDRWDDSRQTALLHASDPVWLRHDNGTLGRQLPLSSHGFAKSIKRYARQVGLHDFHLHRLRHTVARIVGEESGSLTDVQTLLGHQHLATTRVYLQRIKVKRDKHSDSIMRRLDDD